MTNDNSKRAIKAPIPKDNEKALLRGIIEAWAEFLPGGSILTKINSIINPSQKERLEEAWQVDISAQTNDNTDRIEEHEGLLRPKEETITGALATLVHYLAHACPDGRGRQDFTLSEMIVALPNEDPQEIEDAVYELEGFGFVKIKRFLSGDWYANLNQAFYEQFDYQIMGWDTKKDAVAIVQKMLELDSGITAVLHKEIGWEKRRFNPAFRQVVELFPDGRVSKELQSNYPAASILLAPEDKVMMRRFVR